MEDFLLLRVFVDDGAIAVVISAPREDRCSGSRRSDLAEDDMWSCPSSMRAMLPGQVGLARISQHGYDEGYDSCIAAAVEFVASAKLMRATPIFIIRRVGGDYG